MTTNDVYERLGVLEQLVQNLYEKAGVPMPDLQTLARSQVSAHVQQLLASGDKMGPSRPTGPRPTSIWRPQPSSSSRSDTWRRFDRGRCQW
jgi:hypothetical protein